MLEVNNLCVFKNGKTILKKLSFKSDSNFLVISGKSGSGKTTFINCIAGIETITDGEIIINNTKMSKLDKKQREKHLKNSVGLIFQNFGLIENESVYDNLKFIEGATNEKIDEVLDQVGIKDLKNQKVYFLSGGEQQRVAIARVMLKKCEIILADEPTGSLDTENEEEILQILENLSREKKVIVVSHSNKVIDRAEEVIYL